MGRLASLLKIRPGEGRLVALVALLFACLQAGQGLGDNSASALFLLRFGVDFLPYMFIAVGALTFIVTLAYSAGLGRYQKGRFFTGLIAGSALLILLERLAILFSFSFLYPTLWLTVNCLGGILGTITTILSAQSRSRASASPWTTCANWSVSSSSTAHGLGIFARRQTITPIPFFLR